MVNPTIRESRALESEIVTHAYMCELMHTELREYVYLGGPAACEPGSLRDTRVVATNHGRVEKHLSSLSETTKLPYMSHGRELKIRHIGVLYDSRLTSRDVENGPADVVPQNRKQ
jgi:hypothetical protein